MALFRNDRRETLLPLFLLMAAAYLLYANTFGNAWTYDDIPVIVRNADIGSLQAILNKSYGQRPLREISYLPDYLLFGLNPMGWHIQNIFWHALNAFLLFILMRRLCAGRGMAWVASILFLVHPIQVEVVANISHRKDSLALAFVFLSFLSYMEIFNSGKKRFIWLGISLGLAYVALLGKQNALVLPLAFIAYEFGFVPREKRLLANKWVFGAGALASVSLGALYIWRFFSQGNDRVWLFKIKGVLVKAGYMGPEAEWTYFLMVLKSWSFMFLKLIWPFDLALEYSYSVPHSPADPWVLAAVLGTIAFGAGLWLSRKRAPVVFFGLAWLGIFWLPTSNIFHPLSYFAADRYLYAPSVGIFIVIAYALGKLFPQCGRVKAFAFSLAALFLCVLTWQQNQVWRNPMSLWSKAVKVSPDSSYALNYLGTVYWEKGDIAKALHYLHKAAENVYYPEAQYNLGWMYEKLGDQKRAQFFYGRGKMPHSNK